MILTPEQLPSIAERLRSTTSRSRLTIMERTNLAQTLLACAEVVAEVAESEIETYQEPGTTMRHLYGTVKASLILRARQLRGLE